MEIIKSEGFILHQYPFSETSKILKVFSKSSGLISLMAKGASRPKSKFRGLLKSMSVLEIIYSYKGETELNLLRDVSVSNNFSNIENSLEKQSLSNLFLEVYLRHLYGPEPSIPLFDLLNNSLRYIDQHNMSIQDYSSQLCDFLLQFFAIMGFKPQFENCLHCNSPIEQAQYSFDLDMGGPVCRNCEERSPHRLTKISIKILKWLKELQVEGNYSGLIESFHLERSEYLLLQFLYHHSSRNKPLNSYSFYQKVLNFPS